MGTVQVSRVSATTVAPPAPPIGVQPVNLTLFQQNIVSSNQTVIRVDVYDRSKPTPLLGSIRPTGGSVTADFATGQRRTLNATFDPSAAAMIYPGVELWPFSGFNYGSGPIEVLPLGQFPVTATDISISGADDISVTSSDKWQWITGSTFLTPYSSVAGVRIKSLLSSLVIDTGMWSAATVSNSITSNATAISQVWDQDRSQAIADLCKAVGAEAFVSRSGQFILRDRRAKTAPAVTLRPGDGQRLISAKISTDISNVYNVVTIIPANVDPAFYIPPVTVRILDPNHPAYYRPGVTLQKIYRLDGAQFGSTSQARAAGQKVLTRISAKAEQAAITCHPDVSLDESDCFLLSCTLPSGQLFSKVMQIQQISYPLTVADDQQITSVSTRSDEDFNP